MDRLDLTARSGEVLGVLGSNGAGKTTTIKMIAGLIIPDQGEIHVQGLDLRKQRREAVRHLGAVLEGNRNIYWDLTVWENLEYWGALKQVPRREIRARAEELMSLLGLAEKRHTVGKHLSRGMQQKLAIACSLIHDPQVLLLDEPTLGLDVATARAVKEQVKALKAVHGRTIILTTHQMDLAQALCDRIAIISRGRLLTVDRTENLIRAFSRDAYRFLISGAVPVEQLRRYGSLATEPAEEGTVLTLTLNEPSGFFRVVEALEQAGALIRSVCREEANLEEIFLQLTEGAATGGAQGG